MALFFTSDTHFGHANIIRYSNRPYNSVAEMEEALVQNWNEVVEPTDDVYHLGDFFYKIHKDDAVRVLARLNGKKYLIRGNHDQTADQIREKFIWVKDYFEMRPQQGYPGIILCHYAFRVWRNSHRGAWHLYGHSHGSLPDDPNSLSFDIGVDCHNYRPLGLEQIKAIMDKKTFKPIDHHGK